MSSSTNSYARAWDARLDDLPDTPEEALYARGEHVEEALAAPTVAVVGARACSGYGAHVARTLGRDLAAAGVTVISGLARGVDGEAHRGALDSAGRTLAVFGCGIDRDYPAAHAESQRRAGSSPSTRPVSSPHPGASRPATGSSRPSPTPS
jgi:DNA processing protein